MNLQNNKLTKEEKLVYLLNKIEEISNCNQNKELINNLKTKLLLQMNSNIESLEDEQVKYHCLLYTNLTQ